MYPSSLNRTRSNGVQYATDVDHDSDSDSGNECTDGSDEWVPPCDDADEAEVRNGNLVFDTEVVENEKTVPAATITVSEDDIRAQSNEAEEVQVANAVSSKKKRKYTYIKRSKQTIQPSKLRESWLSKLESMTEAKIRRTNCCKTFKCFYKVDYDFFSLRSRTILSSPVHIRRTILTSMLGSNNSYFFNGNMVCVKFLKKSFKYSTRLIAETAENNRISGTVDDSNITPSRRQINAARTSENFLCESDLLSSTRSVKKEAVISFLRRLSEDCSERMPDKKEMHLPFFQKQDVYNQFVQEFKKLYQDEEPHTSPYFLRVWKESCSEIRVRRATRFSVSDVCKELRSALHDALVNNQRTEEIMHRKMNHMKLIAEERLVYQQKRDRARLDSSRFFSIIFNGADQSAFGLPHFTASVKSKRGHALKVKLVGLLEHNIPNYLNLFTMTEDHATGANHIVETVYRFLKSRRARGPLPPALFVQLDNCSRENKNKYLMAYFETLVSLGVFEVVEVGFLPVGHTHEDIDRCFSETSGRLRVNNAVTLRELHSQLSLTNRGFAKVCHLKRIANWSGLCDNQKSLRKIDNITQFRYFKFSNAFDSEDDIAKGPLSTRCHVKHKFDDDWRNLFHLSENHKHQGILKSCPDLRRMPPLLSNDLMAIFKEQRGFLQKRRESTPQRK